MSEFDLLAAAAGGMEAQRAALDVFAHDVAAAEADGTSFVRLVPKFAVQSQADANFEPGDDSSDGSAVKFIGTTRAAGTDGDAITEMVAVLGAQRAYEANASVFDTGKRLMERTIDVGRA